MEKTLALTLTKDTVNVLRKAVAQLKENKVSKQEDTEAIDKVMECMDTALLWFYSEEE